MSNMIRGAFYLQKHIFIFDKFLNLSKKNPYLPLLVIGGKSDGSYTVYLPNKSTFPQSDSARAYPIDQTMFALMAIATAFAGSWTS